MAFVNKGKIEVVKSLIAAGIFLLLLLCLNAGNTCYAEEKTTTYEGLTYRYEVIETQGTQSVRINGLAEGCEIPENGIVAFPEFVDGIAVKSIGTSAFVNNQNIKEVRIPDSVETIEESCFDTCRNLTKVTLSRNLKELKMFCFSQCGITEVDLPETLESMEMGAFYGCFNIKQLDIPEKITVLSDSVFAGCIRLEHIDIGQQITSIAGTALDQCYSLKSIDVDQNNPAYISSDGVLFTIDRKTLVRYPGGKTETSYEIPEGTEILGTYSFHGVQLLEKVVIPGSVKEIGMFCFGDCPVLSEVIMSEGVEKIDNFAFWYAQSLRSIALPDSVTEIGEHAFSVSALEEIRIPDSVKEIKNESFIACFDLKKVELPVGLEKIGQNVFERCSSLGEIYIPESVTEIDANAFQGAGTETEKGSITIKGESGSYAEQYAKECGIDFDEEEHVEPVEPADQEIVLPSQSLVKTAGAKAFPINASAMTKIVYESSNSEVASVDEEGKVTPIRPGKAEIHITALADDTYKAAEKTVVLTVKPGTPKLTVKNLRGRQVKLTWSKVKYIKAYEIFVKGPGEKKFKKRLTKSYKVKSVTHMGLKKGKVYRYKVRVYSVVDGDRIYGACSHVKKIKIKR